MAEQHRAPNEGQQRSSTTAPDVKAAGEGQKSVESAPAGTAMKDAMGNEPEIARGSALADKTQVKQVGEDKDGNPITGAFTDPSQVESGPYGMALPGQGEIAGGNIKKVLEAPPSSEYLSRPLTKEQAAMLTQVYQKLAGLVNRPPSEWGLLGPGDTVKGSMKLLDLRTGEKVDGMDGHRVNEGQLYANLRNFPESLSQGDMIEKILGG
jgi:hypothetical protein